MIDANWKEFVEKAKTEYYKIGSIPCPAFNGELVYFNKQGWNHLIRKGRKFREQAEQEKRIRLIPRAVHIVRHIKYTHDYRTTKSGSSVGHFWEMIDKVIYELKPIIVHVIIRRKSNGRLHFFSVF
jgi:hypothetical protein